MYRNTFGPAFHLVARVNLLKYAIRADSLLHHGRLRPTHFKGVAFRLINTKVVGARVRNDQVVGLGTKRY